MDLDGDPYVDASEEPASSAEAETLPAPGLYDELLADKRYLLVCSLKDMNFIWGQSSCRQLILSFGRCMTAPPTMTVTITIMMMMPACI